MKKTILIGMMLLVSVIAVAQGAVVVSADPIWMPPEWLKTILMMGSGMPMVGPFLMKAIMYLSIFLTVATILCGAFIGVIRTLAGAFNLAGASALADKVQAFEDGSIAYYLKYFSAFNAQAPAAPVAVLDLKK